MAITQVRKRQFKPQKTLTKDWDSFRKGLNTLLRDSELGDEQVRQLQNMVMDGKGITRPRPGTKVYHQAAASGKIRGLHTSKISDTTELLSVSDGGFLTKMSGTSHTQINGASWASGSKVRMTQLQNKVYLVQEGQPLRRYDGSSLIEYVTINPPVSLTATNLSGVSGAFTWSWRMAFTADAGRTFVSNPVTLANLPEDLTESAVLLKWSYPSGASGLVSNTQIYGRVQGDESYLSSVPAGVTQWIDNGSNIQSQILFMPDFNETGGPQAKYVIKSKGKLVVANLANAKSRLMWSGADVNIGKFHYTAGGGVIDVEPDDGQEITGIRVASEDIIVVFKERSTYQVKIAYNSTSGINEAQYTKISDAIGCLSGDTVVSVENDIYFVGLRAGGGVSLNSLGYEPNILANVLRTKEISAAIAPDLRSINKARYEDMWGIFYDSLYYWFYPIGATEMRCLTYDYQRGGFAGPHTFPDNPVVGTIHYDSDGKDYFIYGDGDDGNTTHVSDAYTDDKGVDFNWIFKTKKEDFGVANRLKTLLTSMVHVADLTGNAINVDILYEDKLGKTTSLKNYSITPRTTKIYSGWGSFLYGTKGYGSSTQAGVGTVESSDYRKIVRHNKAGVVSAQVKVTGTGSDVRILEVNFEARAEYGTPSDWLVT